LPSAVRRRRAERPQRSEDRTGRRAQRPKAALGTGGRCEVRAPAAKRTSFTRRTGQHSSWRIAARTVSANGTSSLHRSQAPSARAHRLGRVLRPRRRCDPRPDSASTSPCRSPSCRACRAAQIPRPVLSNADRRQIAPSCCRVGPVGRTRLPVMALAGRGIRSTIHRTIAASEVTSGAGVIAGSAHRVGVHG
jgi:hypothetical protein